MSTLQHHPLQPEDGQPLCEVLVGDGKHSPPQPCEREPHLGPHALLFKGSVITYRWENPAEFDSDACRDCFQSIKANPGKGRACGLYCAVCLPARQHEIEEADRCPHCGAYDMENGRSTREMRTFNSVLRLATAPSATARSELGTPIE